MAYNMEIRTKSAQESKDFGKSFANSLRAMPVGRQGGIIIALTGDLGAGKTTFAQGLASGLGIEDQIISPTFVLMRLHDLTPNTQHSNLQVLSHVDLYRLEDNIEEEIKKIGLSDLWNNPESITIIEWADKARDIIPANAIWINIEKIGEEERMITVINSITQ